MKSKALIVRNIHLAAEGLLSTCTADEPKVLEHYLPEELCDAIRACGQFDLQVCLCAWWWREHVPLAARRLCEVLDQQMNAY